MLKWFTCLLVIVFNVAKSGEQQSLETYYNNVYLGEKRTNNYAGPLDPRTNFIPEKGSLKFLDDTFNENLLNQNLQADAFELQQFWFSKILNKSTCPDEILGQNFDYIRYLYRLVSMSYLFESIKINHRITKELNLSNNSCNLSYKEMFESCSPKSDDMKKFKERVFGKFANEFEKIKFSSLSNKEIESWMNLFHLSTDANLDPTFSRLHNWCKANEKDCKSLDLSSLKGAINNFCLEDKEQIKQLCNEEDQYYGLSSSPIATTLVKSSNAFGLINTYGMGEDCLRRFVESNLGKEDKKTKLNLQFNAIYKYLESDKTSYIQGALFLPGALKEFDMKGLSDFLIALKPPKVEAPKTIVKVISKPISKPKDKVVKKVEEKKVEPVVVVEEVKPAVPKISEFERAVLELNDKKLEQVIIDMDKFRDDFEFTSKMISSLSVPLKKFQTRQALKDMRDYDHFGKVEAPVGIVFIKFLIDTDNHQGLYNVINVLGEKFYISNDFEFKKKSVFAQLKNDASTKNRWQIILLKNPTSK